MASWDQLWRRRAAQQVAPAFPDVTPADLSKLKNFLNTNDRGGFYLEAYRLTGSREMLLCAQVATYSGTVGGIAYAANAQIQEEVGALYPAGGVNQFSLEIAQETYAHIAQKTKDRLSPVKFTDIEFQQVAKQAWADKQLAAQFPGQAYLLLYNFLTRQITAGEFKEEMWLAMHKPGFRIAMNNVLIGGMVGRGIGDYTKTANYHKHELIDGNGHLLANYYVDKASKTAMVVDPAIMMTIPENLVGTNNTIARLWRHKPMAIALRAALSTTETATVNKRVLSCRDYTKYFASVMACQLF